MRLPDIPVESLMDIHIRTLIEVGSIFGIVFLLIIVGAITMTMIECAKKKNDR